MPGSRSTALLEFSGNRSGPPAISIQRSGFRGLYTAPQLELLVRAENSLFSLQAWEAGRPSVYRHMVVSALTEDVSWVSDRQPGRSQAAVWLSSGNWTERGSGGAAAGTGWGWVGGSLEFLRFPFFPGWFQVGGPQVNGGSGISRLQASAATGVTPLGPGLLSTDAQLGTSGNLGVHRSWAASCKAGAETAGLLRETAWYKG